jgi:hypothetical protein
LKSTSRPATLAFLAAGLLLVPALASAHRPLAPAGRAGPERQAYTAAPASVSGTWTPVSAPFPGSFPDTAELLTDGTVLMHGGCSGEWYRLTPDAHGNYADGTWTAMAPMPAGYAPLYFATEVLTDGRMIVNGGEYNGSGCSAVWTKQGALYDPVANSWTSTPAPTGWKSIGDAASVVLQSGAYMLQSSIDGTLQALGAVAPLPATTVTWTAGGAGKADDNDEEGWTLLRNGDVLTVDVNRDLGQNSPAEIYSPWTATWSSAGTAPNVLVDPTAYEIGPAVLLPDGAVFQIGANSCGHAGCPGHTALYTRAGVWSAGPDLPVVEGEAYDVDDGPATILPNGHVLLQASPAYGCAYGGVASPYCAPSHFFEYTGKAFARVNEPVSAPSLAAYEGRMLVLPTGQILWSGDLGDVEIYTPVGKANPNWAPTIASVPTTLARGQTNYTLTGHQLRGLSDGAAYGDDAQMNTNYPLVRITNLASGDVCFARVHDHTPTATYFDMPPASPPAWIQPCDPGPSTLAVVANGIASKPVAVTVR